MRRTTGWPVRIEGALPALDVVVHRERIDVHTGYACAVYHRMRRRCNADACNHPMAAVREIRHARCPVVDDDAASPAGGEVSHDGQAAVAARDDVDLCLMKPSCNDCTL